MANQHDWYYRNPNPRPSNPHETPGPSSPRILTGNHSHPLASSVPQLGTQDREQEYGNNGLYSRNATPMVTNEQGFLRPYMRAPQPPSPLPPSSARPFMEDTQFYNSVYEYHVLRNMSQLTTDNKVVQAYRFFQYAINLPDSGLRGEPTIASENITDAFFEVLYYHIATFLINGICERANEEWKDRSSGWWLYSNQLYAKAVPGRFLNEGFRRVKVEDPRLLKLREWEVFLEFAFDTASAIRHSAIHERFDLRKELRYWFEVSIIPMLEAAGLPVILSGENVFNEAEDLGPKLNEWVRGMLSLKHLSNNVLLA